MSWIVSILLALACFGIFAFLFRVPRKAWSAVLAALVFGLAGYALQAHPDLSGAPKEAHKEQSQSGWRVVDLRKEMIGDKYRSRSNSLVTADALMRQGQYANAAMLLRGAVRDNPKDAEAWLAMANALTFQADGALTPAALLAYRQAGQWAPDSAAPSFFVGLTLISQGQLIEGRELWANRLKSLPAGAPGREALAERLAQLDELLRRIAGESEKTGP